ncbi:MAG TPA: hypothetical protein VEB19_17175 [Gemmatimonadaceae bacterium]|nr:hypothetical protein [Gemmatimonadaceae bacterium]
MIRQLFAIGVALASTSSIVAAQVGYPPRQSPFRDLRETQEVTFFTGWFNAKKDPARVAPQSGPIVGAHYQWRASGPANITFDLARVSSERRVLDPEISQTCPANSRECKVLGTWRWPLYMADIGTALALTGARSYRGLVPELRAAAGIISDFHTSPDVGEFAFGTRFAFKWGGGIRWVPGGRFQLRADLVNHLYSVRYPETYYQRAEDGTSVFTTEQSRTAWLNNPSFTLGFSYLFSR